MTRYVETDLLCHVLDKSFHRLLLVDGRSHVDNGATRRADEVVVVPGDPLGEFELDDTVGSVLRRQYVGVCEDREGPIQRREGDCAADLAVDLCGRLRSVHRRQCRDGASPPSCEADSYRSKVLFNGLFEMLHYPAPIDSVPSIIGIILIIGKRLNVQRVATVVAVTVVALLTLGGCDSGGDDDGSIRVVATTTILGDLAQNVIADAGQVVVLMPIGVNPHDFQPSAQQVAAIQKADLVIANGLGLEEGLSDVLEAAASDGVHVWEVGPDVNPRLFVEAPNADEHDEGLLDPHFWLDPLRDVEAVRLLVDHLSEIEPDRDWSTGAEAYVTALVRVHEESIEMLSVVPDADRKLVTNHRAFGYFSDRYGFEMMATVIPGGAMLANPSSSELASLVETIEREQVPAIFTETVESDTLARTVAAEVGYDIEIVELYTGSLGEPGAEGDTLVGLLRANARRIAEALGRES